MASWKFILHRTDAVYRCSFHSGKHTLYRDSGGGGERGTERGHRDREVEKLQEARGHEKEEGQRMRPRFHC